MGFVYLSGCRHIWRKINKRVSNNTTIKHQAYILVSKGSFTISLDNGASKKPDPKRGAEIMNTSQFTISANDEAEIIVVDVPDEK